MDRIGCRQAMNASALHNARIASGKQNKTTTTTSRTLHSAVRCTRKQQHHRTQSGGQSRTPSCGVVVNHVRGGERRNGNNNAARACVRACVRARGACQNRRREDGGKIKTQRRRASVTKNASSTVCVCVCACVSGCFWFDAAHVSLSWGIGWHCFVCVRTAARTPPCACGARLAQRHTRTA